MTDTRCANHPERCQQCAIDELFDTLRLPKFLDRGGRWIGRRVAKERCR